MKKITQDAAHQAKLILDENKSILILLADALLEHESLDREEIEKIISGKTAEEKNPAEKN